MEPLPRRQEISDDMIWGQLDDDTQAQMELVASYAKARKDGDIGAFSSYFVTSVMEVMMEDCLISLSRLLWL